MDSKRTAVQEKLLQGESAGNVKSKQKLLEIIGEQLTEFWTKVLDFSDIAIGDRERYKAFRSKVLRAGNDAGRFLEKEITRKFIVEYVALADDIVEVRPPSKKKTIVTADGQEVEVEKK